MAKIMNLEEMLKVIGEASKETRILPTNTAFEIIKRKNANPFYHILPDEELEKLKLRKGFIDTMAYECLFNAVRSGHKFRKGIIIMRINKGKNGLVVEFEDEGDGIPAYVPAMMKDEKYVKGFLYDNGERGRGFHIIRTGLDERTIDAVGFNEKRNAIYLMALYR